jgi:activator of HSP90 ATPase
MVLHNPNNWHWVSKDVSAWAKEYLESELIGISAKDGDVTAKVDSVLSMEGDCDVSQRKGKVITIFDVKLQLEFSGIAHELPVMVSWTCS